MADLKDCLYGLEPLQHRLQIGGRAFLAPVKVPVTQKEDVVVVWLSHLLTNKALMLSSEDLVAAWTTLNTILSSHRLKALCANNWVCPLTSSFTETLVDLINSDTDDAVQEGAINVCYTLVSTPPLAPLVTHSLDHCLLLCKGLIKWLLQGHKSDLSVKLTTVMAVEVGTHLRSHPDKIRAMTYVTDYLLLPSVRLFASCRDSNREVIHKLLTEIKSVTAANLFPSELVNNYSKTLNALFSEETKAALSDDIGKLLLAIVSCIENEPVEVSQYLLREFYNEFAMRFKTQSLLQQQLLVVLCFMVGVSFQNPKLPCIVKNGFAAQKLDARNIDAKKKEALLYSVLQSIQTASVDLTKAFGNASLGTWLESLGEVLVKSEPASVEGYQCLQVLLALLPQGMSLLILKNMWNIYCYKALDSATSKEELYSAYDGLLCEVVEVCVKLRITTKIFDKLLPSLKDKSVNLHDQQIIPESLLVCEGRLLFPPRFMASMKRIISSMSHTQVLHVWKSVFRFMKECLPLLKASAKPGELEYVCLVVWLLAVIMEASPALQVMAVVGVAESLADIMTQIAIQGIKPLIAAMLTQPHDNNTCGSILVMCHTWGELHINLLAADVGYCDWPSLPKVQLFNSSSPTDFSHLFPFVSSDAWAQISARVANFGNKMAQLALVQLVIQKFSQASLEQKLRRPLCQVSSEQTNQALTQQTQEGAAKYLMNALDTWGSNISLMMSVHLTHMLPFLHSNHLAVIARHLICGVREGDKTWSGYVNSRHFQEAGHLHPHIFSGVCSALTTVSGSCKRKLSEYEEGQLPNKNYCYKLIKKMTKIVPLLMEFDAEKDEENDLWKVLQECGENLNKMLKKGNGQTSSLSFGNSVELRAMIELTAKLPVSYSKKGLQTAFLLFLFALLIQEDLQGREENFTVLLHAINQTLCSSCPFRLFRVTDASCLMQWLVERRVSLADSFLSQHMANLPNTVHTRNNTYSAKPLNNKPNLPPEALTVHYFDHMFLSLAYKLAWASSNAEHLKKLADFVTTTTTTTTTTTITATAAAAATTITTTTTTQAESLLQSGVFLFSACFVSERAPCKWARRHLSSWILRQLKKMDLATISPATAAAILTAHTIIVKTKSPSQKNNESSNNAQAPENTTLELSNRQAEEEQSEGAKNWKENIEPEEQSGKARKWQKLLRHSFQLAELCLSCGNSGLEEYAFTFLITVAKYSDTLHSHLPSSLLATAWSALSRPGYSLPGGDSDLHSRMSLEPLLLTASPDDYEKLLQDLLSCTHANHSELTHTLQLWRMVISSKALGANGFLKRKAMEHLIPTLVHLITTHTYCGPPEEQVANPVLLPALKTLHEIIHRALRIEEQIKAQLFTPCTTIQLDKLPLDHFCQAFTIAVDIVNSLVVENSSVVVDRTPSTLAAVSHLATSLVTRANQEHKLEDSQIKELIGCGNNLERLVKELNLFKVKLNKVVHFTVANIVGALQQTTVYPAVKTVLERIVYCLLDLCDPHCLSHLLVALPPATTTFLKHLHNNYSTFHRFNPSKA